MSYRDYGQNIMKTNKKESEMYLSNAFYIVERAGQKPARESNDVVVKATILIPHSGETDYWHSNPVVENLRFCEKVKVMGSSLGSGWGDVLNDKYRGKTQEFSASKWATAFEQAENYCDGELQKLDEAILLRVKALADAED